MLFAHLAQGAGDGGDEERLGDGLILRTDLIVRHKVGDDIWCLITRIQTHSSFLVAGGERRFLLRIPIADKTERCRSTETGTRLRSYSRSRPRFTALFRRFPTATP